MIESNDVNTSLTIRRTINAPRQKVFSAWTEAAHLKRWWRANPQWTTEIAEIDLRVGGRYRLGMRDPEQPGPFVCGGEFVEVSPPAKLVYTWSWETPGMEVGESLVTVEFIAQGEMTELVLVHERLPDQQAADKHTEGWTACIANFVSLLESD